MEPITESSSKRQREKNQVLLALSEPMLRQDFQLPVCKPMHAELSVLTATRILIYSILLSFSQCPSPANNLKQLKQLLFEPTQSHSQCLPETVMGTCDTISHKVHEELPLVWEDRHVNNQGNVQ